MGDERKLDTGQTVETDKGTFVVTGVSYKENDKGRYDFVYTIVDPADLIDKKEE